MRHPSPGTGEYYQNKVPFISWTGVSPGQLNSQIVFFEPLQGWTRKIWPLGVGVIAAPAQFWANRKATGKDFISSMCNLSCRLISHFKTPSTGLIFQMKGWGIPWNCPWLPWRLWESNFGFWPMTLVSWWGCFIAAALRTQFWVLTHGVGFMVGLFYLCL